MAIPDLLVADVFQSGAVQVSSLVGGSVLNAIGATLTPNAADATKPSTTYVDSVNRVIEFRGKILCLYFGGANTARIHSYDPGTTLWTEVHTFSAVSGFVTGLYVVNTGTLQRVFAYSRNIGGQVLITYSDDGSSWTDFAAGSEPNQAVGDSIPCLYNNKLYHCYLQNTGLNVIEVDPVALNRAFVAVTTWTIASTRSPSAMCVFDDRLFLLSMDDRPNSTSNWALYEFTGGGFSLNTQITNDDRLTQLAGLEGNCALFKDPGANKLIAIVNGEGPGGGIAVAGSGAFSLTPSGSVFTVSAADVIVPAGLQYGARGSNANFTEDRWNVYVNTDTPGTTEVYVMLMQAPAPGTGHSVYQYVDDTTGMTFVAAGPNITHALPNQQHGGGDRIARGSGNQCVIESAQAVLGGYEISYRVFGTLASQNVTLWYSLSQNAPDQQATISAQTGGSGISGGNTVTGITGDDGVTLFTLRWDINTDSVPSGDAAHILLDINP